MNEKVELQSRVGENIRLLRVMADLSQAELAKRIDSSQNHISRIECGAVYPRERTMQRLADAFSDTLGRSVTLYHLLAHPLAAKWLAATVQER